MNASRRLGEMLIFKDIEGDIDDWAIYSEKVNGFEKRRPKIVFKDRLSLNAGQKYCRMLQESILQYFRTSLSYHLSLRPLFCLFLSGRLRQVSL